MTCVRFMKDGVKAVRVFLGGAGHFDDFCRGGKFVRAGD